MLDFLNITFEGRAEADESLPCLSTAAEKGGRYMPARSTSLVKGPPNTSPARRNCQLHYVHFWSLSTPFCSPLSPFFAPLFTPLSSQLSTLTPIFTPLLFTSLSAPLATPLCIILSAHSPVYVPLSTAFFTSLILLPWVCRTLRLCCWGLAPAPHLALHLRFHLDMHIAQRRLRVMVCPGM